MRTLIALLLCMMTYASHAAEKTRFAKAPIAHLNYIDTDTEGGAPIVLLHAFPLNKNMWDDQIALLKKDHRVIAIDIRGFGKSTNNSPYTLEFVVDDVIALLDQLKIKNTIVAGLSMGGFVALRAVERNPERFSALILADTKSEPDSDASKLGRYNGLVTIQNEGLKNFSEGFLKKSLSPSTLTEKPAVFERAKNIAMNNKITGVSAGLLALVSRTDTTASLAKIQIPTLIIQGELDTVIPMTAAQSLNEKIKESKLVVIPKAGHLSNLENPEAFNMALTDFLKMVK